MDTPPDAAKEEADPVAAPAAGEMAAGDGVRGAGDPGSHRQAIRWDRFLPRRSLRVLLVEHDDSTRHIVAALLRKCSYHVAAVADGMKAWEVLKEKHYNFDLVLTEVVIPSLSGIGLLTKVMASDECKNIPVIMMSSQDSIGVVLKCMLKGAADFLVKPVRRNELRNLWQHVWRRHCMQSNCCASATDNHATTNHSNVNARVESKTGENSDQGDAQSSGNKPEMEIEDIERNIETPQAEAVSSSRKVELKTEQPETDTELLGNKLKMDDDSHARVEYDAPILEVNQSLQASLLAEQKQDKNDPYDVPEHRVEEHLSRHKETEDADPNFCQRDSANDSAQGIIDCNEPRISKEHTSLSLRDNYTKEALCETSTSSHSKSKAENCSSLLEFSLKRAQLDGSINIASKQKHAWNHSDASAFSRYAEKRMLQHSYDKPVSSALCMGTGESIDKSHSHIAGSYGSLNAESCSLSSKEPLSSHQEKAGETTKYFQVRSSSNKEDACLFSSGSAREEACVGQSSNGADSVYHHPQFGFIPLSVPVGAMPYQCANYSSIIQPVFYSESSLHPQNSTAPEKGMIQITSDQNCHHESVINQQQHIQYYQYKEAHQSNHWRKQTDGEQKHPGEPQVFPTEHANGSASCSQDIYKSSGSNGCGETMDAVANVGNTQESGNESGLQNHNKELDRDRSRREAALIKFRLKRKDRCFEKKVRYHSRKKLAEQRPRVKGQFVRQRVPEPSPAEDAED